MLLIGTAGYSYEDWNGVYYPEGLDKKNGFLFTPGNFRLPR